MTLDLTKAQAPQKRVYYKRYEMVKPKNKHEIVAGKIAEKMAGKGLCLLNFQDSKGHLKAAK